MHTTMLANAQRKPLGASGVCMCGALRGVIYLFIYILVPRLIKAISHLKAAYNKNLKIINT